MTRDRRAKQQIRRTAATSGRSYAAARRDAATERRATGSVVTPSPARLARQDEPTFEERHYRLSWADVVLDGRDAADFWYPLPADPGQLPRPGDGINDSGVLQVRVGNRADLTVTAHVLRLPATRPAILVCIRYPDGYRLATVGLSMGEHRTPTEAAWRSYLTRRPDGFARALAPRRMHPAVSEQDHDRAARTGAWTLRTAATDPHRWYAPYVPPQEGWPDGNGVTDLVQAASYGFRCHGHAEATIENLGDEGFPMILDAQDAGFSLDNAEDRAWVAAAGGWGWLAYHPRGWADIVRLRTEGWTISALRQLHLRLADARDHELTERRRLNPFDTDLGEQARLMWQAGEAAAWVSVTGSASAASRLIEQGQSLHDLT